MLESKKTWALEAFCQYEVLLKKYAFSLCQDIKLSEDCVQECFLKLCKQQKEQIYNVKSWLYTVCRNEVYQIHRKKKSVEYSNDIAEYKSDDKSPAQRAQINDDLDRLEKLLQKLPETKKGNHTPEVSRTIFLQRN